MNLDEIIERKYIQKRTAALGPKFLGAKCDPALEAVYKRLFVGLEIVSWPQPQGLKAWISKKIGFLNRQDGIDLLLKPYWPTEKAQPFWESLLSLSKGRPYYYWRTTLIAKYIAARSETYIPVKELVWLKEADPLLYTFLSDYGRVMSGEDFLALGMHFEVERISGKPTSFWDVLEDYDAGALEHYLSFPEGGEGVSLSERLKEMVDA